MFGLVLLFFQFVEDPGLKVLIQFFNTDRLHLSDENDFHILLIEALKKILVITKSHVVYDL